MSAAFVGNGARNVFQQYKRRSETVDEEAPHEFEGKDDDGEWSFAAEQISHSDNVPKRTSTPSQRALQSSTPTGAAPAAAAPVPSVRMQQSPSHELKSSTASQQAPALEETSSAAPTASKKRPLRSNPSPFPPKPGTEATSLSVEAEAEEAEVDWDAVNAVEDKRREHDNGSSTTRPSLAKVTFREAYETIRFQRTESWTSHVPTVKRVSDHVKTSGFWAMMWSCMHTEIKEGSDEFAERDFILALQFVPLSHEDPLHQRILVTVYRALMKPPRGAPDPASRGSHWERLGFQGSDPATDLRSTGILGLLQILYLLDYYPTFCGFLWRTATNPLFEFPFVLVCFNFSAISMESLKERGLHDTIEARRRDAAKKRTTNNEADEVPAPSSTSGSSLSDYDYVPPPVTAAVCDFFVGCLFQFLSEWKQKTVRAIADFGPLKAKLRPELRKHVGKTLDHCVIARNRKDINLMESKRGDVVMTSTNGNGDAAAEKEFMEF